LRPQGIEWLREDGTRSFRLEDLTAANNIGHQQAHDALSDVNATIAIARLLRTRQPRLFAWYFALRRKQRAFELLDHVHRTPVLHISSRYPAERGCIAMVAPLAVHPLQPNKVIVYDLDADPATLLALDAADIADRVFVSRADLPEGVERIPLKAVSANRSPALAPISVLAGVDTKRIRLDPDRCLAHLKVLQNEAGLAATRRSDGSRGGPSTSRPIRIWRCTTGFSAISTGSCCATCVAHRLISSQPGDSRSMIPVAPNCCSATGREIGRRHFRSTRPRAGRNSGATS
jgi:exodeoxyribonuclease-1